MDDLQRTIEYLTKEIKYEGHALSPILEGKETIRMQMLKTAVSVMQELQQYRQIGTVEECREARKLQEAKKPIIGADFLVGHDDEGEPIWVTDYACPECGMGITEEYIYCPYCGQALNQREEE